MPERWFISSALALAAGGCCLTSAVYPAPEKPVGQAPPALTELSIPVPGQAPVIGWLAEPPAGSERAPALLFLHGNGQNLATLSEGRLWERLRTLPAHALIIDYPGYGRSEGKPCEATLVAAARASLAALHARYPQSPVVLVGWSLGAGVAVQAAAQESAAPKGTPIAGLVLISPWSTLLDAAAHHAPRWLARLAVCDHYDSVTTARELRQPALVLHGDGDDLIPLEQGRHVAAALPGLQHFAVIEDAHHNDILKREDAWKAIGEFVAGVSGR